MAAGSIISILSNLPWGQVIEAAPKVAEGATKLWNAVARQKKEEEPNPAENFESPPADDLQQLHAQVSAMHGAVESLKEEMQAASALIKALAEQNTALVQRVELNRLSLIRRSAALAIVSTGLLASVIYLFVR